MKRSAIIVVTIIVLSLVIGTMLYLNSSKSNMPSMQPASTSTTPSSSTNTSTSPSQASMSTDKVSISNFSFSPSSITVKKGTTVTWTNLDDTNHTVTENDGKQGPASASLAKNATYAFTYTQTGTFSYHCTFHPMMVATVTVTE